MAKVDNASTSFPLFYRILHQIFLAAILTLALTGLYIHQPFVGNGLGFLMSLCRGVHFFAAALLTIVTVIRLVSMFVGPARDWRNFVVAASDLKKLPQLLKYYARAGEMPKITKRLNPLQMISYSFIFIMALFEIITGFIMRYPDGPLFPLTYGLFGSEMNARVAHFVVTWILISFILIHIYLAIRESFKDMRQVHLLEEEEVS